MKILRDFVKILRDFLKILRRYTQVNIRFVVGQYRIRRKHHVFMHGMSSAAIIGSNYVRYDAETSPDHQYGIGLQNPE